jgi:hypothetical protein
MPRGKKKPNYSFVKNAILLLSGIAIGIVVYMLIFPNRAMAPEGSGGLNEINNKYSTGDFRIDQYYAFRIMAPKDYIATTDQMLGSYLLVGGIAPPRLFLNKNEQIFVGENGDFLSRVWKYNENDCISIWTGAGLSTIEEWLNFPGLETGRLGNKEEVFAGEKKAEVYKLSLSQGSTYVGFMPIESEHGISYFFRTCNENNKTDLINVIKSLKLRSEGGI